MDSRVIRVLLVEDNIGDARLIYEYLAYHEFIKFEINHGKKLSDAIDILKEEQIDIIVIDLNLPDSQGIDTFRSMHKAAASIPIIVMTGMNDTQLANKTVHEGAEDYLIKDDLTSGLIQRSVLYAIERNQYKYTLINTEKRQRVLVEENADSIVVVNKNGQIYYMNPAAESLFSHSYEEMSGGVFGLPITNHSDAPVEIFDPGRGTVVYAEMRSAEVDWDGEPMHLVTLRDVTERVLAEEKIRESEIRFENLFDSIRDAIMVIDEKRTIIGCNPAFCDVYGYARDEIIGQKSSLIYKDADVFKNMGTTLNSHAQDGTILSPIDYRRKDGSVFPGESSVHFLKNNDEQITGYIGMIRDISQRLKAEQQIRMSESELKKAQSYAHIGSWIWNIKTNDLVWSDEMYHLFGIEKDKFTGKLQDIVPAAIHPEDRDKVEASNHSVIEKGKPIPVEYRITLPDGSLRWVWAEAGDLEYDAQGNPAVLRGTVQDITERKAAEELLRRWETIFSHAEWGVSIGSKDGKTFELVNPAYARMHGLTVDEMQGMSITDVFAPGYQEQVAEHVRLSHEKGFYRYEAMHIHKDGTHFPVQVDVTTVYDEGGEVQYRVVNVMDISERIAAEQALREAEDSYRQIFDGSRDGFVMVDADGHIMNANQAYCEMLGYSLDELKDLPDFYAITPEKWHEWERQEIWEQKLLLEGHSGTYEKEYIRKDGSIFPIELQAYTVFDEQNNASYLWAVARDVTERDRIQAELKASEEKYRTYVQYSPIGIYIVDQQGNYVDVNPAACDLVGYSRAELLQMHVRDLIPQGHEDQNMAHFTQLVTEGAASSELQLKCKDNSIVSIILDAVRVSDDMFIGFCTDITEQNEARQALAERERLLNKIFEILPVGLWLADREGKLMTSNAAGRKIWGDEPLVGQEEYGVFKARRLPSGEEIKPEDWALAKTVNEGVTVRDELLEIDAFDGVTRTVINYTAPVLDDQGQVTNAVVVNLDISDLKEVETSLQRSEEKYRVLYENITIGVFRTAMDGKILEANSAMIELAGFESLEKLQQKNIMDFYVNPDERSRLIEKLVLDESINSFELQLQDNTGQVHDLLLNANLVKDEHGQPQSIEGSVTDITELKRTSAVLGRRDEEVRQLYEAGKLLNASLDMDTLYDNLYEYVTSVVPCDGLSILNYDHNKDRLQMLRLWHADEMIDCRGFVRIQLEERKNPALREAVRSGVAQIAGQNSEDIHLIMHDYLPACQKGYLAGSDGSDKKIFRTAVFVPIKVQEQVVGVLNLYSYDEHAFTEDDRRFLESLCHQVGAAAANAQLFTQSQTRIRQLSSLHAIDKAISSSFSVDISLNVLINAIIEHLHVDAACILLFNRDIQALEYASGKGFSSLALQHTRLRMGEGFAGKVALNRERMIIYDINSHPDGFTGAKELPSEGFVSYVGVPLVAKGKLKGVVEVFQRSQLIPDEEWLSFLDTLAGQAAIAIDNDEMYNDLQYSNLNLSLAYDDTIEGWASALELRDRETEGHTRRVTDMTLKLAREMGIPEDQLMHYKRGALLHDIGKMAIPDDILLKPGPLDDDEWEIMRQHPGLAYDMLTKINFLRPALDIPYAHHERWDGSGYPRGLQGEQIPLAARVFAIVDVWDALCSDRPYRKAWLYEDVIDHLRKEAGKHFDPHVVDVFLRLLDDINHL